jgi:molecular chaperone GrpE (heat shock protein)
MSTRRSGRATKAVKYTSASEGSDFEDKKKKPRKPSTTKKTPKPTATPKKAHKRAAESDNDDDDNNPTNNDNTTAPTTTPPKPKRQKKDPSTLAAESQEKQTKADKAAHKKAWQDWLASHDASGEQLEVEPDKEESITQTDALKKYGLKKDELSSLLRFEKKNPLYGGTMKLFLEEDVRELGFRKLGMLEGCEGDDEEVVKRGEEIWEEG